jgi:two-component system, cell cycle sensor histidine kinase and response regulator CckA
LKRSVSRKLLAITVGVISLAVALAGGVLLRQHHRELYHDFESGTVALARAIAEYCTGPLFFDDDEGAREILAKLERSTVVGRAVLYDHDGRVVASYDRLDPGTPRLPVEAGVAVVHHEKGYLHVFEPVLHRNTLQGTLYLTASSGSLRARVWSGTLMILLAMLAAVAAAGALAWVLQRTVTRPILQLAQTMRGITEETMGSTRVEHPGSDEIGVLYAGFNRMLDQLAARQHERDRSDARLQALIAALPDPVFVLDEGGHIVDVLAEHPELISVPAAELRGRAITEVTAPDQQRQFGDAVAQALGSGKPQRLAYELDLPTGRRWFDAVVVPIAAETGAAKRYVLFVSRNVTERHTLELDLRQAQKMEALGRLAGGVAHDFNNLLTAIMGYGSVLLATLQRDGQSSGDVEEILKAAQRAALLTQQLLAFSRRQVVALKAVPLNDLVRDMQRMLERIIGEDVQLVADLSAGLPPVLGDPGQLQQVILNLAVNAREAMSHGGTLTLRTLPVVLAARRAGEPELPPGRFVLLEVTDTGVGMDESVRTRVFEPFFTTKGRKGGTGLGLAMVYGIVRQSGGDVSVVSEPQRGTTFRIYLPEAPASTEITEAMPRSSESQRWGSETVLVVEDEPQLKELTCRMLRERGYRVLGAAEGKQALHICETEASPIHLLLTDIVMPRMSGVELAEAARPLRPAMKVLYMSGYSDTAVPADPTGQPAPFLQKPFTAESLARKVRETLGRPALSVVPPMSAASKS